MDLSREKWQAMCLSDRQVLARQLAIQLPTGFAFHSIERYQLGEEEHHVALYQQGDATFTLIPGGEVSIGFDAYLWQPNIDELESWQDTTAAYDLDMSLTEHLAAATLPIRQTVLPPLLIETIASAIGWEAIDSSDPQVQDILQEYGLRHVEVVQGNRRIRSRPTANGEVIAERATNPTHAEVAAQYRRFGFRLPTADEWEYVCGGGASTLFRWGDHVPCDRYPTDVNPEEAAWRRQWALSAGELEYPPQGFTADWIAHQQPNALGLSIASDPYQSELVAESGITRGGDGGCTICGGAGFFVGWLPLATAYFEAHSCTYDPSKSISVGYTIARRVLELSFN
ncbi:hypothetical protein H6F67_20720 [Microcoleus sp. FACHB-1515]|uniref:hypothetical protein n=1 Tax=Cyanophyceae TaxID=3028117 RepID=UPI001688FE47|nr:hypothetical protein [Microcoleus sp. FACHB-1515]MBD2092276.1 hypothetical protein [Microcoleus sp. FACHB-1515]